MEVEIDVTDKSPFFIRPYYVNDEDKAILDKEMLFRCYKRILSIFKPGCVDHEEGQ